MYSFYIKFSLNCIVLLQMDSPCVCNMSKIFMDHCTLLPANQFGPCLKIHEFKYKSGPYIGSTTTCFCFKWCVKSKIYIYFSYFVTFSKTMCRCIPFNRYYLDTTTILPPARNGYHCIKYRDGDINYFFRCFA